MLKPASIMMGLSAKASAIGMLGANSFLGHCLITSAILGLHAQTILCLEEDNSQGVL